MMSRLEAMKSELNALIESLRTGSERLKSELDQFEGHMGQVRETTGAPELAGEGHTAQALPIAPEEHSGLVEQGALHASAPAPPDAEAPGEASERRRPTEPEKPAEPEIPTGPDDTEGARLIALNMALNGTPRDETDRYLAENFKLTDRGGLLDEVYSSRRGLTLARPDRNTPDYAAFGLRGQMGTSVRFTKLRLCGSSSSSRAPGSTTSRTSRSTIPRGSLTVITGLSGSGKSSLAFDTIYAEGQRRYVESLSAYARQFLGQMDKPDVDSIEGLSPAISIDQKTTSRNPRSTVGTVTEIYDYLRLLWARIGHPHCHVCGRPISGQSAEQIIDQVMELPEGTRFMVLAPIVRGRKGEYGKQLEELRGEGFSRAKIDGELRRLDEEIVARQEVQARHRGRGRPAGDEGRAAQAAGRLDRDRGGAGRRAGRDRARRRSPAAHLRQPDPDLLGEVRLSGARPEPGRARAADLQLQLAARRLPALHRAGLADGDRPRAGRPRPDAVDRRGRDRAVGGERVGLLRAADPGDRRALRRRPRDAVGGAARPSAQDFFLYGTNGERVQVSYRNRFGRRRSYATTFEGIVPNLERRYRETDSDFSREKIEEYMTLRPCPECKGARLRPESRAVLVGGTPIHEFTALSARRALEWVRGARAAPSTTGGSRGWCCARSRSGCSSSTTSASGTCRWSARRRRCRAARPSGSGWPRRSAPRWSGCSTSSTSRRSGCTSATTRS